MVITKGFSFNVWREIYDEIQNLGLYLKLCHENKILISEEEKLNIDGELEELNKQSMSYMDGVNMKMPEPRWRYHKDDESTWLSSDKFAYEHKLQCVYCKS